MVINIISFLCLFVVCSINVMSSSHDEELFNAPIGAKSFMKNMVVVSLVNLSAKESVLDGTKLSFSGDETKVSLSYSERDDEIHSAIVFEGFNTLKLGITPETYITTSGFTNKLRSFVDTIPFTTDENNVWSLGVSFGPKVARSIDHTSGNHPAKLIFWNREQCLKRTTEGIECRGKLNTYKLVKSWLVLEEDAVNTLNFFIIWHNRNALVYQYVGREGVAHFITGSTGTEDKLYLNCALFSSCVLKTFRIMHYSERLASSISRQKGSALHLCYRQHHRLAVARKTVEKEDLYELTEHAFYLKAILGNPAVNLMALQPSFLSTSVNSTNELDLYSYSPTSQKEWTDLLEKFKGIGGIIDTIGTDDTEEESHSFLEDTKKSGWWCNIM